MERLEGENRGKEERGVEVKEWVRGEGNVERKEKYDKGE